MVTAVEQQAVEAGALARLVARILAGDRRAEDELVERFQRGVRLLARRHCRPNDPAADDIAQEVLFGVLERVRAGGILDPQALPAYFRTAVAHAAAAEYRRRRDRGPMADIDSVAELDGGQPDPMRRLAAEQLRFTFRRLLTELPIERDRELLRRFYLKEQSKEAVCAELAIDEGHFHRVVHRARQRFREILLRAGIGLDEG